MTVANRLLVKKEGSVSCSYLTTGEDSRASLVHLSGEPVSNPVFCGICASQTLVVCLLFY
jgi:hypothetical protein